MAGRFPDPEMHPVVKVSQLKRHGFFGRVDVHRIFIHGNKKIAIYSNIKNTVIIISWIESSTILQQAIAICNSRNLFGDRKLFLCPITGHFTDEINMIGGRWGSRQAFRGALASRRPAKQRHDDALQSAYDQLTGGDGYPRAKGRHRWELIDFLRAEPFIDRKYPDFPEIVWAEKIKLERSLRPRSSRLTDGLGTQMALRRGAAVGPREVERRLDEWDARCAGVVPDRQVARPSFAQLGFLEDHPALDIRALNAAGLLRLPLAGHTVEWVDDRKGMRLGAMLLVDLREGRGIDRRLVIEPLVADDILFAQEIGLIGPPAARRIYLRCPFSAVKTDLLFLRAGRFASRQVNRLVHQSQRKCS